MKRFSTQSLLSEKDKKLVGHLVKKKKAKGLNVYFNKTKSTGKPKYFSGKFYSKKNDDTYTFRSSYELKCFQDLEKDTTVSSYLSEVLNIPYTDRYKKERIYVPDIIVMYKDGTTCIWEVKPEAMLADYDVKAKAKACKSFMKTMYPDQEVGYRFMTEKVLFKTDRAYVDFLNKNRNKNFEKKVNK